MNVPPVDRAALAGRIQGFGNVNPPALEDDTNSTVAKRAVTRLGDMLGEEVMLTVEDFREKGAVSAVKDAVADAGDILIDGVAGLIGWIRGEEPPEEENAASEAASKVLANGPNGAAYGISQASPTGGINAVWIMPEEADPATLQQLAMQSAGSGFAHQMDDPRVPKNIQPYQPSPGARGASSSAAPNFSSGGGGYSVPGGPMIAPYKPAPSGPPGFRAPPFVPGANIGGYNPGGLSNNPWGPGGYNPTSGGGAATSSASTGAASGAKVLVDRIAKGEVLVGPEVAKRLVSQCQATKTSGKMLGEMVCERTRRLYLGLDGGDPADADAALARLLGLVDALAQHPDSPELAKVASEDCKKGVNEELLSLRSSSKHKDAAEPMLRRLGLIAGGAPPRAAVAAAVSDLLGGGGPTSTGGGGGRASAAVEADLLGGASEPARPSGGLGLGLEADLFAPAAPSSSSLEVLLSGSPAAASDSSSLLAGLSMDVSPAAVSPAAAFATGATTPSPSMSTGATLGTGARMEEKKDQDIFSFVGSEMSKAGKK